MLTSAAFFLIPQSTKFKSLSHSLPLLSLSLQTKWVFKLSLRISCNEVQTRKKNEYSAVKWPSLSEDVKNHRPYFKHSFCGIPIQKRALILYWTAVFESKDCKWLICSLNFTSFCDKAVQNRLVSSLIRLDNHLNLKSIIHRKLTLDLLCSTFFFLRWLLKFLLHTFLTYSLENFIVQILKIHLNILGIRIFLYDKKKYLLYYDRPTEREM